MRGSSRRRAPATSDDAAGAVAAITAAFDTAATELVDWTLGVLRANQDTTAAAPAE